MHSAKAKTHIRIRSAASIRIGNRRLEHFNTRPGQFAGAQKGLGGSKAVTCIDSVVERTPTCSLWEEPGTTIERDHHVIGTAGTVVLQDHRQIKIAASGNFARV